MRGYHGNEVTTCTVWPRAANSSTIRVITTPVGAVSGSKCGHSTTSGLIEDDPASSADPEGQSVCLGQRSTRVIGGERSRRDETAARTPERPPTTSSASPMPRVRAGARARRRRRLRQGPVGRSRSPEHRAPSLPRPEHRILRTRSGTPGHPLRDESVSISIGNPPRPNHPLLESESGDVGPISASALPRRRAGRAADPGRSSAGPSAPAGTGGSCGDG